MNKGKVFEQCFQESCQKQEICCIRLVDSNKFGDHTESRFTPNNICDFICYDGNNLFLLELKHTENTSISFNQPCDEKGSGTYMIKPHQVKSLKKYTNYSNVHPGLILDFADRQTKTKFIEGGTYYIDINVFKGWADSVDKKSISLEDAKLIGIPVDRTLKKVNYTYDIKQMCCDISQWSNGN